MGEEVELFGGMLVREFLKKKGLSKTLQAFDSEISEVRKNSLFVRIATGGEITPLESSNISGISLNARRRSLDGYMDHVVTTHGSSSHRKKETILG